MGENDTAHDGIAKEGLNYDFIVNGWHATPRIASDNGVNRIPHSVVVIRRHIKHRIIGACVRTLSAILIACRRAHDQRATCKAGGYALK